MKKIIDIVYIIILILAAILLVGREALFEQPQDNKSTTPVTAAQTHPPVLYDTESSARMLDLVENRVPLSPSDEVVKAKLSKRENPVHETETYSMEYISSADEFLVEIRTMNINQAKEESVAWLLKQGVSEDGLCHLPVVYYLNSDTANSMRDMNIRFNPLPPGC
jgi:hypothetical protein